MKAIKLIVVGLMVLFFGVGSVIASGSTPKINPKYRLSVQSWCRSDAPAPNFEYDADGNKIPLALYKTVNGKRVCEPDRYGPNPSSSFAWCFEPNKPEDYGQCYNPATGKYEKAIF